MILKMYVLWVPVTHSITIMPLRIILFFTSWKHLSLPKSIKVAIKQYVFSNISLILLWNAHFFLKNKGKEKGISCMHVTIKTRFTKKFGFTFIQGQNLNSLITEKHCSTFVSQLEERTMPWAPFKELSPAPSWSFSDFSEHTQCFLLPKCHRQSGCSAWWLRCHGSRPHPTMWYLVLTPDSSGAAPGRQRWWLQDTWKSWLNFAVPDCDQARPWLLQSPGE